MNTNQHTPIGTNTLIMQTSMSPLRKTSLTAGIIYLLTFVSIPTLTLYGPIHQPNYILSNSNDTNVIIGGILEIIVKLTSVATAVVLYPVLKKQHEGFALGLVASRILEASTIFVGVSFLLAAVTLHKNGGGADSFSTSHALVALYDRIFLLGQGFIPAINDLLLGILLFKSRLVPRTLSIIGIAGGAPLIAGYLAVMFGVIDRVSPLAALSALPVAVFEFSLGIYLVIKGFRPSAVSNQL
jgi:hypothetical protein